MSQAYSDPSRENDPHALPDLEVFYLTRKEAEQMLDDVDDACGNNLSGWYYWFCFPGCLPDSDLFGPFPSKDEALKDARI